MSSLTLYPSNWLYNAGVIGLLEVMEEGQESVQDLLPTDGSFHLPIGYFDEMSVGERKLPKAIIYLTKHIVSDQELKEWLSEDQEQGEQQRVKKKKTDRKRSKLDKYKAFEEAMKEFGYRFVRAGNKLFASKTPYQNLVQLSEWQSYEFPDLVRDIPHLIKTQEQEKERCDLCRCNPVVVKNPESKLQARLTRLQSAHLKELGPSLGEFPNGFWNMEQSMRICFLCSFLIIHHHLAFTRLSDGSEIFINAPSFQVMWYLNKFAREVLGSASSQEMRTKRSILAMSVIEYATRIQATLGVWTGMNIEVVSKRGSQIEFFSLPYEVIQLLSDRRIASLLSQIGEFEILNRVLDQDFSRLMEMGYRLLRIGLKPYSERAKSENEFVNQTLRLEENQHNPAGVAQQIFKLCALIEEQRKRREEYDHIRFART